MKHENRILATCLLLLAVVFAHGQTTSNTSGGKASGSGGAVSYSLGQIAYQTHSGTNGSVSEGVQQAYDISVVIGIENTFISMKIIAYPSPTTDYLILKVNTFSSLNTNSMVYQLYDLNGRLLQSKKLTSTETQINMSTYVPSIYFVRIVKTNGRSSQKIKEFKIMKN